MKKLKIRYTGRHACTLKLIDGGVIQGVMPGEVVELIKKDYDSLIDLAKRTDVPEWEPAEKVEVEKIEIENEKTENKVVENKEVASNG